MMVKWVWWSCDIFEGIKALELKVLVGSRVSSDGQELRVSVVKKSELLMYFLAFPFEYC